MRVAILVLAVLFAASPAYAWGAKKKVEKHAINILVRRLRAIEENTSDPAIEESARRCLYFLEPWSSRLGEVKEEDEIQLDSTDEEGMIHRGYGLALKAEVRRELWTEIWNAPKRWLWRKIKTFVWHSLPWGVIATYLYFMLRGEKRVTRAYDRDAESLPPETRLSTFTSPRVQKAHARFRNGG